MTAPRRPALLYVPAIFGVDEDVRARLHAWHEAGILAEAVDPFSGTSDPGPLPYAEAKRAMARAREVDPAALRRRIASAVAGLKAQPACNGRAVLVGVCFGGRFAWWACADGHADGMVAWHGAGLHTLLDRVGDLRGEVALHYGGEDPVIPQEQVAQVRDALGSRPGSAVHVHPGCGHGFTHRDHPTGFDPAAAAAAERSVLRVVEGLA